jgi:hypothetical protein
MGNREWGEWGTRGPHGGASALGGSADLKRLALGIRGMGNRELGMGNGELGVIQKLLPCLPCLPHLPYSLLPTSILWLRAYAGGFVVPS